MRIIPVIDLFDSRVVHAAGGERAQYKPVKSVLCRAPDPLTMAAAFRDQLGLRELYIADLNAIQGYSSETHRELIGELVHGERMRIILDAGVSDVENARAWLDSGIRKVVIGSETLGAADDLSRIPANLDADRLIFSVDMRSGKVVSRCSEIASAPAMELMERLWFSGWREAILLDLARVGSEEGANSSLVSEARTRVPGLNLLVGGGVARAEELFQLRNMGIAGVLLATALHSGSIGAHHISEMN